MSTNTLVIVGLILVGAYLFLQYRQQSLLSRELHNEETLEWTDYRGQEYKVRINRRVG